MFTILFVIIEMEILSRWRKSKNFATLLLLLPLMVLWANIHIQFVFGLFLCGALMVEVVVVAMQSNTAADRQIARRVAGVTLACMAATLCNPYHVWVYQPLLDIVRQPGFYHYITEVQALDFRNWPDWVFLVVAAISVFALGRRRKVRLFPVLVLMVAMVLAFRSARDAWFGLVMALWIIGATWPTEPERLRANPLMVFAGAVVATAFAFGARGLSNAALEKKLSMDFPVAAVEYLQQTDFPEPLWNDFNWGGYLIWSLPGHLVSMDSRGYIHGLKRFEQSVKTWSGDSSWRNDAELLMAGTVILPLRAPLVGLLRNDLRFDVQYEDETAIVFFSSGAANTGESK
ncbi:MAG: hypothetical protein HN348_32290 [Proteobacteria bacterium]|nr:hypothetical protein [Pseudomonadota bacterium]